MSDPTDVKPLLHPRYWPSWLVYAFLRMMALLPLPLLLLVAAVVSAGLPPTIAAVSQRVLPRRTLGEVSHYLVAGEEVERDALLGKLVDYYFETSRRIFDAAGGSIDVFFIGNDFGTQCGPIVGEKLFRRFFLPPLKRLVDLGHGFGLKVMLHCCGGVRPLLEVRELVVHYGLIRALQGVSITVGEGQVVALFNQNELHKIEPGNYAEFSLKTNPGRIVRAKVDSGGGDCEFG